MKGMPWLVFFMKYDLTFSCGEIEKILIRRAIVISLRGNQATKLLNKITN
jgi:hypothetical protein